MLIRAIEKIYAKKISEMTEAELNTVANDTKDYASKNPAEFKTQVETEGKE